MATGRLCQGGQEGVAQEVRDVGRGAPDFPSLCAASLNPASTFTALGGFVYFVLGEEQRSG
jgi:hypothetical protein